MSKKSKIKTVWTSTSGLPKWNQSPVDLNQMYVFNRKLPALYMKGHISKEGCGKMTNTGTTVKVELIGNRSPPIIFGGPLYSDYQFSNLQFRWGPTDACGAEHSVEGSWFSMEAQAVHWNTSYGSIEKCLEKDDGFVIVSFFLQVIGCEDMVDNPNFSFISDNLRWIKSPNSDVELRAECLCWMQDVCTQPGYYTYHGSFTTPPYTECVKWIVIPRPVRISASQAEGFRKIYNQQLQPILRNYRSQHKLHQRKIFFVSEEDN